MRPTVGEGADSRPPLFNVLRRRFSPSLFSRSRYARVPAPDHVRLPWDRSKVHGPRRRNRRFRARDAEPRRCFEVAAIHHSTGVIKID